MAILFLVFAIVALVLGFVGLITIIKGFVDKNNKNIWLGTILVCIMFILGLCGTFFVARKALDSKRFHEGQSGLMFNKCDDKCMQNAFKVCCPGDSAAFGDSTEVQVVVEKKCMQKEGGKTCPHHMK